MTSRDIFLSCSPGFPGLGFCVEEWLVPILYYPMADFFILNPGHPKLTCPLTQTNPTMVMTGVLAVCSYSKRPKSERRDFELHVASPNVMSQGSSRGIDGEVARWDSDGRKDKMRVGKKIKRRGTGEWM